jgi:hypothetical protein
MLVGCQHHFGVEMLTAFGLDTGKWLRVVPAFQTQKLGLNTARTTQTVGNQSQWRSLRHTSAPPLYSTLLCSAFHTSKQRQSCHRNEPDWKQKLNINHVSFSSTVMILFRSLNTRKAFHGYVTFVTGGLVGMSVSNQQTAARRGI